MANFTPHEQLMLELINRARMDPAGEAARYGIALNEGVPVSKTISTSAKQVLAGNDQIGLAADKHSQWMIDNDVFSHYEAQGTIYGADPFIRIQNAGYTDYSTAGENIAFVGTTGVLNQTQSVFDAHMNLFKDNPPPYPDRGHRTNMLDADYKEIGVGVKFGAFTNNSTTYNGSLVTTDFGTKGTTTFITGVVYNDTINNDNFFSVGEESAGVGVSGSGASDSTGAGGGYELAFASGGSKTITFDLATDLVVLLSLGATNVKIDAVNGNEIWSNVSLTSQSTAIKELHALGISKMNLSGSSTGEKIFGNKGANKLDGNGGADSIEGGGGKDSILGGTGHDTVKGGGGADKFVFEVAADSKVAAPDIITDFGKSGADKLDLSSLYSGDLIYRDEAAITGVHEVNVTQSGADVIVHINLSGDLADDMRILLKDTTLASMTSTDFIV